MIGKKFFKRTAICCLLAMAVGILSFSEYTVKATPLISVTGITLSETTKTLNIGDSFQLADTISPVDATDKNVSWTSDNLGTATVDNAGNVTAVGAGTAKIWAGTNDGLKLASCSVNVNSIYVSGLSLSSTKEVLHIGDTVRLDAFSKPDNATNKNVNWTTSNSSIASVNADGLVIAKASGDVVITATSANGNQSAKCTISVVIALNSLAVSPAAASIKVGDTVNLTAALEPSNATTKDVTWTTFDSSIASVDALGNVKGLKVGSAVINAVSKEGSYVAQSTIAVNPLPTSFDNSKNTTSEIINTINNSDNGVNIVIDGNANPIISKDIFNAIIGKDKNITITYANLTITFNGLSIKNAVKADIDFSLKTVTDSLKALEIKKINSITGKSNAEIMPFSFKYDGELPGTATIKVFIGKDWANKAVSLCRYFSDKNTFQLITSAKIDANGFLTYTSNHYSDYFVTTETSLPQTGFMFDTASLVMLGTVFLLLGSGLTFIKIK